ncbi:MAG TPA: endonuclease/exonuclease/phosphatase family protein [Polyangiaceae bacterium]|nr:endonuclease/exonuclease/phosphatase family protein [Polyangiaceae bacterium]
MRGAGGYGLRLLAVGYPALLLGIVLALRFVGERWWVTTLALYLPRWPLGLPLPFLGLALLVRRRPALLAMQLLALLIWLFPLAGLQLGTKQTATPGRQRVRIVTMNIHGSVGASSLSSELRRLQADIIVQQEAGGQTAAWWKREFPRYEWRVDGEFVIGSRFPIAASTMPPLSVYGATNEPARYARYRLLLPNAELSVYNVHPPSPSKVFERLRHGLERGPLQLWWPGVRDDLQANALRRRRLLEAVVADARDSAHPVIIAGDTNLPELSLVLANAFHDYRDAFSAVGWGFGYTFPVGRTGPWMRIDRIIADESIRYLDARVTNTLSSDHLGMVVDLEI